MHRKASRGRPWTPPPSHPLYGYFAVHAALTAKRRTATTLYLAHEQKADADRDRHAALERMCPETCVVRREPHALLTARCKDSRHQGIVMECSPRMADAVFTAPFTPLPGVSLLVVGVEDDMTFGAIVRSCEFFGVRVILMRMEGMLTASASRASAGALEYATLVDVRCHPEDVVKAFAAAGHAVVVAGLDESALRPSLLVGASCLLVVGSDFRGVPHSVSQHATHMSPMAAVQMGHACPAPHADLRPRMTPSTTAAVHLSAVTNSWGILSE